MLIELAPVQELPVYLPAAAGKPARLALLREMSVVAYELSLDRRLRSTTPEMRSQLASGKLDEDAKILPSEIAGTWSEPLKHSLRFLVEQPTVQELDAAISTARSAPATSNDVLLSLYYKYHAKKGDRLAEDADIETISYEGATRLTKLVEDWANAGAEVLKKD
jgi:hypothetical protein